VYVLCAIAAFERVRLVSSNILVTLFLLLL
jgi:hypothetical protein